LLRTKMHTVDIHHRIAPQRGARAKDVFFLDYSQEGVTEYKREPGGTHLHTCAPLYNEMFLKVRWHFLFEQYAK